MGDYNVTASQFSDYLTYLNASTVDSVQSTRNTSTTVASAHLQLTRERSKFRRLIGADAETALAGRFNKTVAGLKREEDLIGSLGRGENQAAGYATLSIDAIREVGQALIPIQLLSNIYMLSIDDDNHPLLPDK